MIDLFQRNSASDARAEDENVAGGDLDQETLAGVLAFFPIGKKLRYFPDNHSDIILESLVLAYVINGHFVYTQDHVAFMEQTGELLLTVSGGSQISLSTINSFHILVPNEAYGLDKLDYVRLAELDRNGVFKAGGRVTLISANQGDGAPVVETEVRKIYALKTGIYANQGVVEIQVLPGTLHYTEQRRCYRLKTRLPVTLRTMAGEIEYPCTLEDFSEVSVRIGFEEDSELAVAMHRGRRMLLTIALPVLGESFTTECLVQQLKENFAILSLLRIQKQNGQVADMSVVDALFIKATLLKTLAI